MMAPEQPTDAEPTAGPGSPASAATSRVGRIPEAVVGLGASAGGLQALKEFFSATPDATGLAYVVVMHLAPDHESHLAGLLQSHTRLPVMQVTGDTPLEADHIYVIPPGRNLTAVDTHLRLTPLEKDRRDRAPIDHFFRTLASTHDGHAIGVILSGSGTDGAQGVRHIREMGGMVVVQAPDEAEYDGMPSSAIGTGLVDLILPIRDMPRHIVEFARTQPRVDVVGDRGGDGTSQRELLRQVLSHVRARTGHDFAGYKDATVARRIGRRMQVQRVEQLGDYLELLRNSERESDLLLDDLLINVTSFFRDADVFRVLEQDVVPRLFDGRGPDEPIRVWSVGCATGEEAYGIGMLLLEESARRDGSPGAQVFASDLHERSILFAREGVYPHSIEAEIEPERLGRFFRKESGGYRIGSELRESVIFAMHNLLRDPPFSRLDLIVCRNVLIYLQPDVQEEVARLFHYALNPDGYLLLGTAETLDRSDLFRVVSKQHRLYRRHGAAGAARRPPTLPVRGIPLLDVTPFDRLSARAAEPGRDRGVASGHGGLHLRMLERYAPPSLLVEPNHNVVHISENAARYLQHRGGAPTTSVFRVVRDELRAELRAALHVVRERQQPYRSRPIPLVIDGEDRHVVLRVSQPGDREVDGYLLVIFDDAEHDGVVVDAASAAGDATVRELELELEVTKNRLHVLMDEFDTSQEEMRASNEELQSANEELRSTLEELETSKEELQSINEELQTVNQESRQRVEELSQLSGDLQNLLAATDVATLFLDRELRIMRFTPRIGEIFNIRTADRGRPLSDLTHHLGHAGLIDEARHVLQTLVPIDHEIEAEDGRWHLMRVLPYRSVHDRIEGVVITFVDITPLKRSESALRESEAALRPANALLEQRVEERTAALAAANDALTAQIAERERAEAARSELLRLLASAEEIERQRLSRELHDEMGQLATGLLLGLESLRQESAEVGHAARVEELIRLADRIAREVQDLALHLRPPALDNLGLEPALRGHLEEWSARHGIEADLQCVGLGGDRLPAEIETTLYRVVQEGLTNVLKHAGASRVGMVLERRGGSVAVILEDDGRGFEPDEILAADGESSRLGLRGMRERVALLGGSFHVESELGAGATVFVRIPLRTGGQHPPQEERPE